ncbi:MAG: PASTA domain-containing protein [Solirubrobacteraceae bacterium]
MNGTTATPARPVGRAQSARRGGPSGRLEVGEYVGQPAADAAQDVRRAGLKPGLERSFGCEAELLGLVVAQEPGAGSELARNGMVTLYVAAPGAAPLDGDAEERSEPDPDPAPATSPQAVVPEVDAPQAPPRTRRRRKPGHATRAPQAFENPPAPVPADRALADEAQASLTEVAPTPAWALETDVHEPVPLDGEEYDDGPLNERVDGELSDEEFVVHADDVFAGRSSRGLPAWRRVYPRRRTAWTGRSDRGVRARLAEHPVLVSAVGGMLAVWAVVGVVVALASHPARTHSASLVERGSEAQAIRVPVTPPAPKAKAVRAAGAPALAHTRSRRAKAPPRPARPTPAERTEARPVGASVQAAPSPRPAAPAVPASAPPVPVQEQTQGGLFSP